MTIDFLHLCNFLAKLFFRQTCLCYTNRLRVRVRQSHCQVYYHCANGDEPFGRQIGFGAHSVHQCKFNDDCDGDVTEMVCVNGPLLINI